MEITAGVAVNIAAIALFPVSLAILIPALGAFVTEIVKRRVWYKTMFNVSQTIVTYTLLHLLIQQFYQRIGLLVESWGDIVGLLAVGVCYYLLNTSLVVMVVSLTAKVPFKYIWQTNFRSITWHQVSMVCGGFLLAFLWTVQPWSIVLIVVPIVMLRQAMALTAQLETQTHEAIEILVNTVDARDVSTFQHSERVAIYARDIAGAMHLDQAAIEQISLSARLHDLGKVGIGDTWLYKKGPLTHEERLQFERHSELGANIVARFSILGVEHAMVRSHHERWDGHGYPDGLMGAEIPLGARVICVADSFDAMTSDRPYRSALSHAEARRRLAEGAGTQFDPAVIAAALLVLPGLQEEQEKIMLMPTTASSVSV